MKIAAIKKAQVQYLNKYCTVYGQNIIALYLFYLEWWGNNAFLGLLKSFHISIGSKVVNSLTKTHENGWNKRIEIAIFE